MDFWRSEYEDGEPTSVLAGLQEFVDSPNLSSNSVEYSSDSLASDQTEVSKLKPSPPKVTLLAKRRLQAYSAVNKIKLGNVREEKNLTEKNSKHQFKKAKKTIYPDEAAKNVIRDIELLKRSGFGYGPKGPSPGLPPDIIIPGDPIIPITLVHIQADSPMISLVADKDGKNTFKRREIKCRNIRKSDTYRRRSASPKGRHDRTDRVKNEKKEYPINWTQYKELSLDPQKDSKLKSKLLKMPKDKKFEFKGYFNFQTPPLSIDLYKGRSKPGESTWIPFPYLRCTASKPQILYNTNHRVTSPGFLTREQLFALIPKERKLVIEKLGKFSRCVSDNKPLTARKWYPKNWKKFENSEAKLLENSVGLSFLQGYSDEEDDIIEDNKRENIIKQHVDLIEDHKKIEFDKDNFDLSEQKEELTPSATPKAAPSIVEEIIEKDSFNEDKNNKKSRWEDITNLSEQKNLSNYDKTPPLEDKEEGEVHSEEESKENLADIDTDEYAKTKEELKALEAVLKSSTDYLGDASKETAPKREKPRKGKKKRNKVHGDKVSSKSKFSKKRSKKKVEKKAKEESSSKSESLASEEEVTSKTKQRKKKDSKTKVEKARNPKEKKKKSKKKKVDVITEIDEDVDQELDLVTKLAKKKKRKRNPSEKGRKRTVSGDSRSKGSDNNKTSADITQEDYEDDIKFFAARFDAESKLKGKTRHKTKTNITLEELPLQPKTEEKIQENSQKRKTKCEGSGSDGLFSPETARKKEEQKGKDEAAIKHKEKEKSSEEAVKKDEIKIDLLKMNENYLKQKKKEEAKVENEDDGGSDQKDGTLSKEKGKGQARTDKKVLKEVKDSDKNDKSGKEIIDLDKSNEELSKTVSDSSFKTNIVESDPKISAKASKNLNEISHPDWEKIRSKRKRRRSVSIKEKKEKKSKHDAFTNLVVDSMDFPSPEVTCTVNVRKEKVSIDKEASQKENEKDNSWESDEDYPSLDLEIPLNIKPFSRRETKLEKYHLSTKELQKQTAKQPSEKDNEPTNINEKPSEAKLEKQPEKKSVFHSKKEAAEAKEKRLEPEMQLQSPANQTSDLELEIITKTVEVPECIVLKPEGQTPTKKRRWDLKSSTPLIKLEKSDEIIDLDANSCVTLENEYEEFMKAVTTKEEFHSPNLGKSIAIDTSSDSSVIFVDNSRGQRKIFDGDNCLILDEIKSKVITHIEESTPKPPLDIPTIQIPLPPVKSEQLKPVPVPSPKLEAVLDLNNPLINLSLSANVTQNITLSLATSMPSISAPITSSIDISKTSVEISTPLTSNTLVSMNNIPVPLSHTYHSFNPDMMDLKLTHIPGPTIPKTLVPNSPFAASDVKFAHIPSLAKPESFEPNSPFAASDVKFAHIPSLAKPETMVPNSPITADIEPSEESLKLVFTSLTLPSKKLLDNSKLNLADSDNDDEIAVEQIKRRRLEALIEDNKRDVLLSESPNKLPIVPMEEKYLAETPVEDKSANKSAGSKEGNFKKASPHGASLSSGARRPETSPRRSKRQLSPVRRREPSPRRRSPPPRRKSPRRSPKRRSPVRRKKSPGRRIVSPRRRRSSISPRRRLSPKRKPSPLLKGRQSPLRRNRSPSPRSKRSKESRFDTCTSQRRSGGRPRSPLNQRETSPLKRSVADSTISDDQLPQADDYYNPALAKLQEKDKGYRSPERVPLDIRINQVLGYDEPTDASPKPISSSTPYYHTEPPQQQHHYQFEEQYSSIQSQVTTPTMRIPQSTYRQVGNMLQIVPTENLTDIPMPQQLSQTDMLPALPTKSYRPRVEQKLPTPLPKTVEMRSTIVQVGNMLQIVPTEMVPTELIPVPPVEIEIKTEKIEELWFEPPAGLSPDKPSAEASMLLKVAERRAERDSRRLEREIRRKEKEKRRKEKEKVRQAKLKIKTENMIKRALELEEEEEDAESDTLGEQPVQWPPIPMVVAHSVLKEVGKGILVNSNARQFDESFLDERKAIKTVQFADGIRPGDGTSPSAGEDLCSPPPPKKKLPKEKRYKKIKFSKKSGKKKVKVKIIKKPPSPLDESDSDDILPPPSPPPGSPPPHVFPPRIKVNPINNVPAAYLASIIQTAQQQQQLQQQPQQQAQYQSNLYRTSMNLLMAPPQSHLSSVPSHVQSPHGVSMPPALSPQTHYHPGLVAPPPPPPPPPHSTGHNRHY